MQFHVEGFTPGDPELHAASDNTRTHEITENLPGKVDVLIVGCGPAGLTLAAQLAVFPEISTCIVDQKPGPLQRGQADGIACRSMEMFNAFGFVEQVLKEACWVNETTFWQPKEQLTTHIERKGRVQDVEDGLSEFPHVILNQARVHDFFLQQMEKSPSRLKPDYSRKLLALDIDSSVRSDLSSHPVTCSFERIDSAHNGKNERIRARYVVGCDGARSTVRQSIGVALHGDSANHAWGVMDILAVTDFPDIRMKSLIRSANRGSIIVIPREGGYLVRFYVELGELNTGERIADRDISIDHLIAAANDIMHPYSLEVKEVAWWSVYEIGQRLCERFDDVSLAQKESVMPRVFIAGDACHTHSPKAGQGMNVSMRDAFNLGWKLISVLLQRCKPEILNTYSDERQKVAKTLIDFDREWSSIMASAAQISMDSETAGEKSAEFQDYFTRSGRYTAGTAIQYQPSMITGGGSNQHLARGFVTGMRFHSAQVIRLADARPVHLGHTVKADGRWRLFVFADAASHPSDNAAAISKLCHSLLEQTDSPITRFTPVGADMDGVIDVRLVFQQHFRDLEITDMPALALPRKGRYQLVDYEKVFCCDPHAGIDIFEERGIDRAHGCVVLVRPDQHIAQVLSLDACTEITLFFDVFMIAQR